MTDIAILLVDDEKAFTEILATRLTRRGYTVTCADSGDQGLHYLRDNEEIAVVVLDLAMPGKDGLATLAEMKSLRPLVEVIMLTGHATVENAIEGMKKGAFDYLMKPCDIDLLIGKVTLAKERKNEHEVKIMQAEMKEITGRYA